MPKKIVTVVGARPQFIKASAFSRVCAQNSKLEEVIIHTGQHYDLDMSEIFFSELEIKKPQINLSVGSKSHGIQTGEILTGIERNLIEINPDLVLTYGDTNSTLAAALAAVKMHIPIAHIEAGLRSFNRKMPEEINRILTDHISSLLFAPTAAAVINLEREGIFGDKVMLCGDIMFDVSLFFAQKAKEKSRILKQLALKEGQYILATIHREENTEDLTRLRNIFSAFQIFSSKSLPIVLPLHPRTRAILSKQHLDALLEGIQVVHPLGYLDMIQLEKHAALIATDSGGVQKEAFFYKVPCLTLRDQTEWVELVDLGWNQTVDVTNKDFILSALENGIGRFGKDHNPYGAGDSANKILDGIGAYLL